MKTIWAIFRFVAVLAALLFPQLASAGVPAPKAETRVPAIDIVVETSLKATSLCAGETRSVEAEFAAEVASCCSIHTRGGANLWNDFQKVTRGQYGSRAEAAAAYRRLIKEQSPWPDGVTPAQRVMQPGETFNMAMAPGQPSVRPGGFGSLDPIPDVRTVRQPLAVKVAWKPEIDRVVTYRVRRPLPIREGPVGPQVDLGARQVLPGGGHQLEMLVPGRSRMDYLEIVGESAIK